MAPRHSKPGPFLEGLTAIFKAAAYILLASAFLVPTCYICNRFLQASFDWSSAEADEHKRRREESAMRVLRPSIPCLFFISISFIIWSQLELSRFFDDDKPSGVWFFLQIFALGGIATTMIFACILGVTKLGKLARARGTFGSKYTLVHSNDGASDVDLTND